MIAGAFKLVGFAAVGLALVVVSGLSSLDQVQTAMGEAWKAFVLLLPR